MTGRKIGTPGALGIAAALILGGVLVGACGSPEPIPPANPGSPFVQDVPQMGSADGSSHTTTYCLAPAGTGLRVFASVDGHGRLIGVPVDVSRLPERSPYRCP